MKIEIMQKNVVKFNELKCGDVFGHFENVYLKIANDYATNNAYNLRDNIVDTFDVNDEVIKLKAKLVIE